MKRFSKRFVKGASSSSSRSNVRSDLGPRRTQLLDLPQQLLHSIMLFVACNSLRDMKRVKSICKIFKNVVEEDIFFKEVDLFPMANQAWFIPIPSLTQFRLRCLELENPFAFFMRGLFDFFCKGHLERGLESIRFSAEKGYDEAKYSYSMIMRIMTHNSVSESPIINSLSRYFYTQTRRKMIEAGNNIAWGVYTPPLFQENLNLITTVPLNSCNCAHCTLVGISFVMSSMRELKEEEKCVIDVSGLYNPYVIFM